MAGAHDPIKTIANEECRAGVLQNAGIQPGAHHGYERDHQPD